jgi:predicted transcriptional regulator
MSTDLPTSPEFVRWSREWLGLTQTELGKHLGVSKRTIIRWEMGHARIRRRDIAAITMLIDKKALRPTAGG